jgi:2-polyprenyl-3-methyl-5-hydroxy-6-metoxy-1,4-benzoquinol methylase
MKRLVNRCGDKITRIGERYNIRLLIYNPITWARFFTSSRHGGRIFSQVVTDMFPNVRTCLDVGSGAGGYVYWLKQRDLHAIGVEYSRSGRLIAQLQGALTLPFDCGRNDMCPQLGPFDLVFSIEVAEHIPKPLEDQFIDYIASQGRFVIFSAAQPNQPGQGHVNCQPLEHWREAFAQRGFYFSHSETSEFCNRIQAHGFKGFFPKNCQIFRRQG